MEAIKLKMVCHPVIYDSFGLTHTHRTREWVRKRRRGETILNYGSASIIIIRIAQDAIPLMLCLLLGSVLKGIGRPAALLEHYLRCGGVHKSRGDAELGMGNEKLQFHALFE